MNRWVRTGVMAAVLAGAATLHAAEGGEVADKIDWAAVLGRSDMVWDKLPAAWEQGAFLGNGLLGENLYTTSGGKNLTWHIGRSDVVSKDARIPVGDLVLQTVGTIESGAMRLDLWNAEVTGTIKTSKGEITFRSFTHADQMVNVIELTASGGEANVDGREGSGCHFTWVPGLEADGPPTATQNAPPDGTSGAKASESDGMHISTQPLVAGGSHVTAWKDVPGKNGSRVVYVSVGFSAKGDGALKEATDAVAKAQATGLDALTTSHQAWWHGYWPESFVSLPDARMESFWNPPTPPPARAPRAHSQK